MINFNDLLALPDDADSNKVLRSAFWPATPPIDISDNPTSALMVLINLTDKLKTNIDLLDKQHCKQKLIDKKWWHQCLKTAEYRHTHNIKFPDYRSTGIIRLTPIGKLPDYMFSSLKINDNTFAYAQNASDINKAIFLCSDFIWQGKTISLATALSDISHPLWLILKKLGCTEKCKKLAQETLSNIPDKCALVSLSPNYLPQIRLPLRSHEYISLTPVASHRAQASVHHALNSSSRTTGVHQSSRSASVGSLITSTRGKIKQFKTPPKVRHIQHDKSSIQLQWLNKERFHALVELNLQSQWLITSNKRKQLKMHYKSLIKEMIIEWLASKYLPGNTNIYELTQLLNLDLSKLKQGHRVSYQPTLIKLFEHVFISINKSSEPQKIEQSTYLLIPNMHVSNANAESSAYTVGFPSIMGVYGFIHAFERKLQSIVAFHFSDFALCLHAYHLQKRGLTKEATKPIYGPIKTPGIVDGWQCDFTFSLVLKIKSETTFDIETILSSLPKRLCRGNVHIRIDDLSYIHFLPTFVDAVKQIPNSIGQWLILDSNSQLESADALLKYVKNKKRILTCIGYHLLEPPQNRNDSLDTNQHAFCESIIAAVQLTSFKNSTDINQFFWNYHWTDYGPVITSARRPNETAESPDIPRFN